MNFEKLGNIADLIAGQSPPSSSYNKNGIGVPFFQGKADYGVINPTIRNWCSEPTKISFPGDILISVRAPVGPVNINIVESCIGRGLSAIRVKKYISRDYIYFFLKINESKISNLGVGSTFTAITQKDLKEINVPIPTYFEQLHIANILTQAENLISQRKASIRLLDEYLKSTFLEMFGDPGINPKCWHKKQLGEHIEYIGDIGSNGSNAMVAKNLVMLNEEDYAIMIRTVNLNLNNFTNNVKYVSKKTYDFFKKSKIYGGEIIMNKIGSAGNFWIMPNLNKPVSLGLNQLVIRPKNLTTLYLYHYLCTNYGKMIVKSQIRGATTKSITKTAVKELPLLYPPMELQSQFVKIVEKTDSLKTQYHQSLLELENLYGSLSQKAFRGELCFNEEKLMIAAETEIGYNQNNS